MTRIKRTPELSGRGSPIRRRYLSDDVQRRVAVSATKLAAHAPLPLAQPLAEIAEPVSPGPAVSLEAALVQTQKDKGQDEVSDHPRPSPQQIADRVYQLMRQDLRLERERKGW